MRDYGKVCSTFWTGKTGKELRGCPEAQIVAAYLITGPMANMIGIYYLPMPMLIHETGLTPEGACKGLARAIEADFALYDEQTEHVFVLRMAEFQIGPSLKDGDKRKKGVLRELESVRKTPFFNKFLSIYAKPYGLKVKPNGASPFEAPSEPLRSQEHEHEQEQDHEHERDSSLRSESSRLLSQNGQPESFNHWQSLDALTKHRAFTKKMRQSHAARIKGGWTEADICKAITRYAELCQVGKAPGYNGWSYDKLLGTGEGAWLDKMLDPHFRGIGQKLSQSERIMQEVMAEMEET